MNKKLNWFSVGVSLATVHYGLGFLIGSGESIYNEGVKGILYALSAAVGLISLIFISSFYRKKKYPIWRLMGDSYGEVTASLTAFLSSFWMVGVIASQILGGAWALNFFGFNTNLSMVFIALLILFLSFVEFGHLSKVFSFMLIFSSLIFFSILLKLGLGRILISSTQLISSLRVVSMQEFLGIVFTTIFVTFIGMDFHQFLVSSKNSRESVKGSLFGGGILLILSLLLLTVVQGSLASGLVGQIKDAKQVVPAILFNFGKSKSYLLGLFFSLPIICVAVGSGSGVTKVVARAISEIGFKLRRGVDNRVVTIILAFTIALTGKSIIDLIVSFYAIYVGSVLIPFLIYVLADQLLIKITPINIQNSMIGGTFFSLLVFAGRFLPFLKDKIDSPQILIAGILGSSLCFSLSNFLHLHRIWRRK